MMETTKKFIEEVDEVMEICKKRVSLEDMKYMSAEDIELLLKSMKLMDTSKEIMVEQAKVLDEINNKLDLLLKK